MQNVVSDLGNDFGQEKVKVGYSCKNCAHSLMDCAYLVSYSII